MLLRSCRLVVGGNPGKPWISIKTGFGEGHLEREKNIVAGHSYVYCSSVDINISSEGDVSLNRKAIGFLQLIRSNMNVVHEPIAKKVRFMAFLK